MTRSVLHTEIRRQGLLLMARVCCSMVRRVHRSLGIGLISQALSSHYSFFQAQTQTGYRSATGVRIHVLTRADDYSRALCG
jgi:hypothetical protein